MSTSPAPTVLVTGAAGFIGSHLAEALVARGHSVHGLDTFIPYYDRAVKEGNLVGLRREPGFQFFEADLRRDDLASALAGVDTIFHLAAMPGLVKSWTDLDLYSSCNILGTQRLLEAARIAKAKRVIYVSTSSVYGKEATGPEDSELRPFSPYGVTKLAGEHLCKAYADNYGLPYTILRYFSVYGPRQRPDMAYHVLIRALLEGRPFPMYGDGSQSRSNTYVGDIVQATLLAFDQPEAALGEIFNVGGGEVITLAGAVALIEELTGIQAVIQPGPARAGDQKHTRADIAKARERLGYNPATPVREGLARQVAWQKSLRATPA